MKQDYYIGVDLGGTVIKAGIIADGKMLAKGTLSSDSGNGLSAKVPQLTELMGDLAASAGISYSDISGMGISFPGIVDSVSGRVLSTNAKYDDACGLDIQGCFPWMDRRNIFIDNDARLGAVGEWKYGAGRGSDDIVMMTIGTGIGCGVVMRGQVVRGRHFQGGCLGGHMIVAHDGRVCTCGNRGCAEAHASSFFLDSIAVEDFGASPGFMQDHRHLDFKKIFSLAADGDAEALSIRNGCMDIWSAAAVNLIHAYDPEVLILGGGVMASAEVIVPYMEKKIHERAWTPWGKCDIVCSLLGNDASVMGAVHCVTEKIKGNGI